MAERMHRGKRENGHEAGASHPRDTSTAFVRGRSPGSKDLNRRLPETNPSGVMAVPHSLTVAGAAPELREVRAHRLPVSPLASEDASGTVNRGASLARTPAWPAGRPRRAVA